MPTRLSLSGRDLSRSPNLHTFECLKMGLMRIYVQQPIVDTLANLPSNELQSTYGNSTGSVTRSGVHIRGSGSRRSSCCSSLRGLRSFATSSGSSSTTSTCGSGIRGLRSSCFRGLCGFRASSSTCGSGIRSFRGSSFRGLRTTSGIGCASGLFKIRYYQKKGDFDAL